ncbi:MAG TPA: HAMP domain-containing sensor histidine kinase [Phycisphaerae bacterium]|nr:HAMP domain-containing sensor histidine kinase [Phycisphaerae bacterium]
MLRIRWYHFYFGLAAFDVIVILVSLHLHNRTLDNVSQLVAAATHLDEQSRWLQLAQQRILDLDAPGNDLFRCVSTQDYQHQRHRFQRGTANMLETLDSAPALGLDAGLLRTRVEAMDRVAENLFTIFEPMSSGAITDRERSDILERAGPVMAQMDSAQYETLRALGSLSAQNAAERGALLQAYEADLQRRVLSERYFIAAVILILVGVLALGRRVQQADRALEEQRRRVLEERRERLAAIGELCSSVAHGIRNPLAAIRSSAELSLELGQLDEPSRQRMQDIVTEGRRLGDRVSGLLSMARATADAFELVNLNEIVSGAAAGLRPEFARLEVKLDEAIPDQPIVVHGDQRQLGQLFVELLSNAMEYSKPGDAVRLAAGGPDSRGRATIIVEDQGPGVAPEVRPRVFDLFFTTKANGTGIGLATVKRIARLHGGDVEVGSSPMGGTKFVVSLPVAGARRNGDVHWASQGTRRRQPAAG